MHAYCLVLEGVWVLFISEFFSDKHQLAKESSALSTDALQMYVPQMTIFGIRPIVVIQHECSVKYFT